MTQRRQVIFYLLCFVSLKGDVFMLRHAPFVYDVTSKMVHCWALIPNCQALTMLKLCTWQLARPSSWKTSALNNWAVLSPLYHCCGCCCWTNNRRVCAPSYLQHHIRERCSEEYQRLCLRRPPSAHLHVSTQSASTAAAQIPFYRVCVFSLCGGTSCELWGRSAPKQLRSNLCRTETKR